MTTNTTSPTNLLGPINVTQPNTLPLYEQKTIPVIKSFILTLTLRWSHISCAMSIFSILSLSEVSIFIYHLSSFSYSLLFSLSLSLSLSLYRSFSPSFPISTRSFNLSLRLTILFNELLSCCNEVVIVNRVKLVFGLIKTIVLLVLC